MADYMGAQTFAPQYPYYSQVPPGMGWPQQQQPMVGQMGTRGVGVEQEQPLSPGGFQGQVGPQQGHGVPQSVNLLPHEKVALKGVLDILKEGRMAMASEALDGLSAQRLTAAHAYLSGFLEAKGLGELGSFIKTIPPPTTRGAELGDPQYDQMIDNFDQFLSNGGQTRFPWGLAIAAAPHVWSLSRKIYKKATGR